MTDYGKDLLFGTFIRPQSRRAETAVSLAQLSERAGLDLVTFQDHPYQPAFLDTWTLLSYVAAKTDRIHLSGNVLNLPLRPPTVLARAAASLDLLSNGRVEMALGGGAFWDEIEAMGGPRRSPGETVQALEEAVDVIRAIWGSNSGHDVHVEGRHYRVVGTQPGPRAAHPIALWLGVLKPRMLRLVGRKADGWMASLAYLGPGDLRRGNQTIDEAAVAAGRDPREIRRLLTISPRDDLTLGGSAGGAVESLHRLAIDDGVSAFILAADDPGLIESWAREIAPAVRAAVAAQRRPASR